MFDQNTQKFDLKGHINARVGQANLSRNILFQELRNNNVFLAVIIQKCVFLNIS